MATLTVVSIWIPVTDFELTELYKSCNLKKGTQQLYIGCQQYIGDVIKSIRTTC